MPGRPGVTKAKRTSKGKPSFDIYGSAGSPHGTGPGKPGAKTPSSKNTKAK